MQITLIEKIFEYKLIHKQFQIAIIGPLFKNCKIKKKIKSDKILINLDNK